MGMISRAKLFHVTRVVEKEGHGGLGWNRNQKIGVSNWNQLGRNGGGTEWVLVKGGQGSGSGNGNGPKLFLIHLVIISKTVCSYAWVECGFYPQFLNC
jgi:hypothetical protein